MNIQILVAHYPDRDSEYVLGSSQSELFEEIVMRLEELLAQKKDGFMSEMCSLANHYFPGVPNRLQIIAAPHISKPLPLSHREREVAEEIGKGTAPKDIASLFGLSVKTVSTYRARIMEKLNLRSNAEIALRMRDYGLV